MRKIQQLKNLFKTRYCSTYGGSSGSLEGRVGFRDCSVTQKVEAGLSLDDGSVDVADLILFVVDSLVEMLRNDGLGFSRNFFLG